MLTQWSSLLNRAQPDSLAPLLCPVGPGIPWLQLSSQPPDINVMLMLNLSARQMQLSGLMRAPTLSCSAHCSRHLVPAGGLGKTVEGEEDEEE